MIINIGENKASVKQTSSGFWYVNELSVGGNSIMDSLALLDAAMYKLMEILNKYNDQEEKQNIKKK